MDPTKVAQPDTDSTHRSGCCMVILIQKVFIMQPAEKAQLGVGGALVH